MNQYDLEDLHPTRLQHTVQCGVRIDFTPRGPGLGRKVGFLPGNRMDLTPLCSGLGRKVHFYRMW